MDHFAAMQQANLVRAMSALTSSCDCHCRDNSRAPTTYEEVMMVLFEDSTPLIERTTRQYLIANPGVAKVFK